MYQNFFEQPSLTPKFQDLGRMSYLIDEKNKPKKKRNLLEEPTNLVKPQGVFDRITHNAFERLPASINFEEIMKKNKTNVDDLEARLNAAIEKPDIIKQNQMRRNNQKKYIANEMMEEEKDEEKGAFRPNKYLGKINKITKP